MTVAQKMFLEFVPGSMQSGASLFRTFCMVSVSVAGFMALLIPIVKCVLLLGTRCFHFRTPGDNFGTSGAPAPRETPLAHRDHLGEPWEHRTDTRWSGRFVSIGGCFLEPRCVIFLISRTSTCHFVSFYSQVKSYRFLNRNFIACRSKFNSQGE